MSVTTVVIIAVVALLIGGLIVWLIQSTALKSRTDYIIADAEVKAKAIHDKKVQEATAKYQNLKNEFDSQVNQRNSNLQQAESKIRQREQQLNQLQAEVSKARAENDATRESLKNQQQIIEQRKKLQSLTKPC